MDGQGSLRRPEELGHVWNTVFVTVHAAAAVVAFAAGAVSLRSGRFLAAYRAGTVVMAAALVPAVLVDWSKTDTPARVAFSVLVGLAGIMVIRAELAGRRPPGASGPSRAYVQHVGFTLISLAVGFAVVGVLRLGGPGWLGGVLAVGIVLAGRTLLERVGPPTGAPAVAPGAPATSPGSSRREGVAPVSLREG
jgi:hypothetical protein